MNKMRDIDLIDQSIKKWQGIVYHGKQNRGTYDCPLCQEYHRWNYCKSCPIEGYTDKPGCINTPYNSFHELETRYYKTQSQVWAANKMLSFLYEMRLWYINQVNQRHESKQIENKKENIMPIPKCPKPMTAADKVQEAIDLITEAQDIMNELMDIHFQDSQINREYYIYGQFGIQQALGEGNPYDGSLVKIRNQLIEDGE